MYMSNDHILIVPAKPTSKAFARNERANAVLGRTLRPRGYRFKNGFGEQAIAFNTSD